MTNILLTPYDGAILGPVAKLLGVIMDAIYMFMHNVFGFENVGLSIIIFTIVIYTLMLPLTYKQQKFSKLSQAMQPEIKAIQEKYKGRRDEASQMAMNNETQMVYDKYGVSPMGSCGQMLIQMPIIMGLFALLRNPMQYISDGDMIFAFHESFLWIEDLSQPDPWILPIIAGVGTFVSFIIASCSSEAVDETFSSVWG